MMDFDVIMVGGGVVGNSMACMLAQSGLKVATIEAVAERVRQAAEFDIRTIGLAYSSRHIMEHMGIWPLLAARATPISQIHISDRGHFGVLRLSAQEVGRSAFAYVVPMPVIIQALQQALAQQANYHLICPAAVTACEYQAERLVVTTDKQQQYRCRLLIAADGMHSTIRSLLGISVREYDYQQTALIANAQFSKPKPESAYERFTDTGPMAVLPLPDNRSGTIWTVPRTQSESLINLPDKDYMAAFQQRFGFRLGRLEQVGARAQYALRMVCARELVKPRVVLIGNAANTIHPIGAQGLNLGLRDVASLAELLWQAKSQQADIGSEHLLEQYQNMRKKDHEQVVQGSDRLVKLFSNDHLPLVMLRKLALLGGDLLPLLKQRIATRTLGLYPQGPEILYAGE